MMNRIEIPKERQAEIRDAWGDLLSSYKWDCFATLTFKYSRRDVFQVVKAARIWLMRWNQQQAEERGLVDIRRHPIKDHYGRDRGCRTSRRGPWWRKWKSGVAKPTYVIGVEKFHESDDLHMHMLIEYSGYLGDLNRRKGWEMWFKEMKCGMARIEPPKSQDDVCRYVSKYVIKDDDIFLSDNFDTPYSCTTPILQHHARLA